MTESARAKKLSLHGISKRFGSTLALDGAALDVRPGTIHALLGENGAGKTTLMRVAFGMLRPDQGAVSMDGAEKHWHSTADAIAAGIGMVHQHFLIVPAMTVAENVALGNTGLFRAFDPRAAAERVRRIGADTGLMLDPSARAADLAVGAQQRLEIVKALAHGANVLILDEPTAVLSPAESRELYAWLRAFVAGGHTVVLITHKVREALALAEDVTVLRHGRTVLSGAAAGLDEAAIVTAMIGASPSEIMEAAAPTTTRGDVMISLDRVTVTDARGIQRLRDATLDIHSGEIVGIAGIEGSGQYELLRVIAGRVEAAAGSVRIPNRIGFVPEDRLRDALIPSMSLVENFALKDAGATRGTLAWPTYEDRANAVIREHDVRASGVHSTAGALSGGNQQKFVLGRELEGSPDALIVENPTRGLDIRAAAHVIAELRAARAAGVAIAVYSSDLDEVLSIADRMLVCFDGCVSVVPVDADAVARALVGLS